MNMSYFRLSLAVVLGAGLVGLVVPTSAKEPERRSERAERREARETPYSNRSQRREREARRIDEARDRERRPDYYQFEDRDPE